MSVLSTALISACPGILQSAPSASAPTPERCEDGICVLTILGNAGCPWPVHAPPHLVALMSLRCAEESLR